MGFKKFLDEELQKSRAAEMHEREERRAAETKLTLEKFKEAFGEWDGATADRSTVTVDGVTLSLLVDSQKWAVMGLCPKCKTQVESRPCTTIADVARLVERFVPAWEHTRYCHTEG